jgi:hypothetical protein
VLGGAYATDGQRFFYFTDRIRDASDPATFLVLHANFECSADARHAYYRRGVIAHADPRSFSKGRAVTGARRRRLRSPSN